MYQSYFDKAVKMWLTALDTFSHIILYSYTNIWEVQYKVEIKPELLLLNNGVQFLDPTYTASPYPYSTSLTHLPRAL